jgi:hypothetical protein
LKPAQSRHSESCFTSSLPGHPDRKILQPAQIHYRINAGNEDFDDHSEAATTIIAGYASDEFDLATFAGAETLPFVFRR